MQLKACVAPAPAVLRRCWPGACGTGDGAASWRPGEVERAALLAVLESVKNAGDAGLAPSPRAQALHDQLLDVYTGDALRVPRREALAKALQRLDSEYRAHHGRLQVLASASRCEWLRGVEHPDRAPWPQLRRQADAATRVATSARGAGEVLGRAVALPGPVAGPRRRAPLSAAATPAR